MSLTELIIETGIHDAIAKKLNEKGKLSKNAIAEGIINNVRKTIIRDQLTDPKFYEQMSKLLDDLIKQSRADTAAYEEFLRKAEDAGEAAGGQAARRRHARGAAWQARGDVIYNNLPRILAAAAATSFAGGPSAGGVRQTSASAGARDRPVMRERGACGLEGRPGARGAGLNALFPLLTANRAATLALFEIVKNQPGY
jgi:type I restriction enzyme R subunit